jgi:hypothetical protein
MMIKWIIAIGLSILSIPLFMGKILWIKGFRISKPAIGAVILIITCGWFGETAPHAIQWTFIWVWAFIVGVLAWNFGIEYGLRLPPIAERCGKCDVKLSHEEIIKPGPQRCDSCRRSR